MNHLRERIAAARGEKKADLVLKNGQLINVFSGEVYPADLAIYKDRIVGIGEYSGEEEIDLNGRYLTPGFIDSHLHIESTFLLPPELARVVVPHGTTAIIADAHGIANVLGLKGIKYLLQQSEDLPLDIFFAVPGCMPLADLETSGIKLKVQEVLTLLKNERVLRLGEIMNFPEVIAGKKPVLENIESAGDCGIEGHAPGLLGKDLNAYISAGIYSDHESVSLKEAQEKLKAGMQILVREGSSSKNLEAILPLITPANSRFFCFCTDDLSPEDLAAGHLNQILRKAVALKLPAITALQMVTINPARHYGLTGFGALAPGYYANINVLSNLEDFNVEMGFKNGQKVSTKSRLEFEPKVKKNKIVRETIHVKPFEIEALELKAKSDYARTIELVPEQTLTKSILAAVKQKKGLVVADPDNDILKLVVVERHKGTGNIGLGLVKGFGLKHGALASSVSHDAHNIICVGVDDEDSVSAVRRVVDLSGGMVAVQGGLVMADLALPVAGLMSDSSLSEVLTKQQKLEQAVETLGGKAKEAFAALAFLASPVIPELRLTDKGLVDVSKFKIVELFE